MSARPNDKRRHDAVIVKLRAELRDERARRIEAEANARRFHAQVLEARIRLLPEHKPPPAALLGREPRGRWQTGES